MVRAYSTGSPGSREARDSLAEATRGHREYTEVRDGCPEAQGIVELVTGNWFLTLSCPCPPLSEHVSAGE